LEDKSMRYIVFGGLFAFGFATVFLGIMLCLGKFRWAYAGQSILVYAQREIINVSIPGGLNFLVIALMVIRPDLKDWLTYPLAFFFFTTLILAVWQPWWLKPAWLRWLEGNYRNVLEEMFAEARAMGRRNWAEQVKTQEGLERWANRVAQKHGWQRRA
jgi:hypothetical protein